jgi:hypothetical protein
LDHVAYITEDLDAELAELKAKGAEFATATKNVTATGAQHMFLNMLGSRVQVYKPAK